MSASNDRASLPLIAMLGTGNMNGAVLAGLVRSAQAPEAPIRATTRSTQSAQERSGNPRVVFTDLETHPDANLEAVRGAGIVIIGVKPHMVTDLLDEIRDALDAEAVVISVAAGVEIATLEAHLPAGIRVVRAMPNTPATLGLGMTGIAPGTAADAQALGFARSVFEAVGKVIEVPESQIAAVAAVSGSGPAYLYLIAEELIRAAEGLGFSADDARLLVEQTLLGAATMLVQSQEVDAVELRRRVTSPKGTTERAIEVLQGADLERLFERAYAANIQRSNELAAEQR